MRALTGPQKPSPAVSESCADTEHYSGQFHLIKGDKLPLTMEWVANINYS